MGYKTSKDYDRLVELLDRGEHIIIIFGSYSEFATKDKNKGYFVGDSWLDCDIEFAIFADKSAAKLKEFCQGDEVEFIDPADY